MSKNRDVGEAGCPEGTDPPGAESFRCSMAVTQVYRYRDGSMYAVCPRCRVTMEREYQSYCDRCGQCLGWASFGRAAVVRKP